MKIELSIGYDYRGAKMGRMNQPVTGKCHLQKVRMVDGGAYDYMGAYWGISEPLYVCQDDEGNQFFVRSNSRGGAKKQIQHYNPTVTFFK